MKRTRQNINHSKLSRGLHGFTLIELLVVISIIGTLAGMFAVAYRGAQQEASTQKTRTTVQKISNVLIDCIEEYSQEPLGWNFPARAIKDTSISPNVGRGDLVEQTRLLCIRDRLRFEMPDHVDDIKWSTSWVDLGTTPPSGADQDFYIVKQLSTYTASIESGLTAGIPLVAKNPVPSRAVRLMRRLSILQGGFFIPIPNWESENANAELLYLIIEDANYDGSSAIEVFGASEIGDTDNDGLKELLDAFGRPIQWLRWPAGYPGAVSSYPDPLDPLLVRGTGASARLSVGDESYDRMGRDPGRGTAAEAGPLGVPLVISGGQDKQFGIRMELDPIPNDRKWVSQATRSAADVIWAYGTNSNISTNRTPFRFADPWFPRDNPSLQLGAILVPGQASDNIVNLDGSAASL